MSCSAITNEYDGVRHDYTRKQGLVWQQVFLPSMAPDEWKNREKLWNAVEAAEKAKDSRLAREIIVALPTELDREQQIALLSDFIRTQFVVEGMCADAAIHDTGGHNPHAHILLTVRPLDERGRWQHKTEKEYLCVRNGEEHGFTAAEFKSAQTQGWEKQYLYHTGTGKQYMPPSAAGDLERADKHPKSTRFGRQNPIAARWNSDKQLLDWREAWAGCVNRTLERCGFSERIDHRSNAARGLDEAPTIHEGPAARALEQKGQVSDRCEINRQIRADNRLLRKLKEQVAALIPTVAEALEKLRADMLVLRYQILRIHKTLNFFTTRLRETNELLKRYKAIAKSVNAKQKERKALVKEKNSLGPLQIGRKKELTLRIAELTEDIEELNSEKVRLLESSGYDADTKLRDIAFSIEADEGGMHRLQDQEQQYSSALDAKFAEYKELAAKFSVPELEAGRLTLRPAMESDAEARIRKDCNELNITLLNAARKTVDDQLGIKEKHHTVRRTRDKKHVTPER